MGLVWRKVVNVTPLETGQSAPELKNSGYRLRRETLPVYSNSFRIGTTFSSVPLIPHLVHSYFSGYKLQRRQIPFSRKMLWAAKSESFWRIRTRPEFQTWDFLAITHPAQEIVQTNELTLLRE